MTSTSLRNALPHLAVHYEQAGQIGMVSLLETLSNFCDSDFDAAGMDVEEQELENLAILLLQQFRTQIDGKLLASCLTLLRGGRTELPSLVLQPLRLLPKTFPDQTSAPCFPDGATVRWLPLPGCDTTDQGTVIGRCFAFARHRGQWGWQYWIWLESNSEQDVVLIDAAWEEDLEQMEAPP